MRAKQKAKTMEFVGHANGLRIKPGVGKARLKVLQTSFNIIQQ